MLTCYFLPELQFSVATRVLQHFTLSLPGCTIANIASLCYVNYERVVDVHSVSTLAIAAEEVCIVAVKCLIAHYECIGHERYRNMDSRWRCDNSSTWFVLRHEARTWAEYMPGLLCCIRAIGGYKDASSADNVFDTSAFNEKEYQTKIVRITGSSQQSLAW